MCGTAPATALLAARFDHGVSPVDKLCIIRGQAYTDSGVDAQRPRPGKPLPRARSSACGCLDGARTGAPKRACEGPRERWHNGGYRLHLGAVTAAQQRHVGPGPQHRFRLLRRCCPTGQPCRRSSLTSRPSKPMLSRITSRASGAGNAGGSRGSMAANTTWAVIAAGSIGQRREAAQNRKSRARPGSPPRSATPGGCLWSPGHARECA